MLRTKPVSPNFLLFLAFVYLLVKILLFQRYTCDQSSSWEFLAYFSNFEFWSLFPSFLLVTEIWLGLKMHFMKCFLLATVTSL